MAKAKKPSPRLSGTTLPHFKFDGDNLNLGKPTPSTKVSGTALPQYKFDGDNLQQL